MATAAASSACSTSRFDSSSARTKSLGGAFLSQLETFDDLWLKPRNSARMGIDNYAAALRLSGTADDKVVAIDHRHRPIQHELHPGARARLQLIRYR